MNECIGIRFKKIVNEISLSPFYDKGNKGFARFCVINVFASIEFHSIIFDHYAMWVQFMSAANQTPYKKCRICLLC